VSVASRARPRAARVRGTSLLDRIRGAVPLLTVFAWLCLVYAVEAWSHGTPWLFSDELEWTQLARSVADTGHAARRGVPYSWKSIYTYVIAPAWLLHDTGAAYAAVKYLGSVLMAATVLPAYGLARTFVGPRPALFAAAGSAAIPAVVYGAFIIPEPLAYPYATLCFFLIARALLTRRRWWIAAAIVASLATPAIRGELAVIPAAFLLAALLVAWSSERARAWRARWAAWDWVGAAVLLVGAVILLSAYLGHQSYTWLIATGYYKHRMWTLGLWAGGALTIGLGVLPVVVGLASVVPARGEPRSRELDVFRSVLFAGVLVFALYTAVKASYLSTVFETRIEERNLIYVAPLLFLATAVWIERRRLNPFALAAAGAFVGWMLVSTPYRIDLHFYGDAPGLAILQALNRWVGLTPAGAKVLLLVALSGTLAALVAARAVRVAGPVVAVAALLVLAWNVTGEIGAAAGSNDVSTLFRNTLRRPLDWLDRSANGQPVLYIGQNVTDRNGVYTLEFWNRSLKHVWSLDGTAPGPGPTLTPDLAAVDGRLSPAVPDPYVVTDAGVNVVGTLVASHKRLSGGGPTYWRLVRATPPLRLRDSVTGRDADGWVEAPAGTKIAHAAYSRFSTPDGKPGFAVVRISRREWGGTNVPGHVRICVGPLIVGADRQPATESCTRTVTWTVNAKQARTFYIPAPSQHFRAEIEISPTFVPQQLDPNLGDARELGAVVAFGWASRLPQRR
jgi:hypothetical protein